MSSRDRLEQMIVEMLQELPITKRQEAILALVQNSETKTLIWLAERMMKS